MAMNEDVFLVFAAFGIALLGFCFFFVREWEANKLWYRFRLSTAIWVTMPAIIAAGFINMSDRLILVAVWAIVALCTVLRVLREDIECPWTRATWIVISFLPVSGLVMVGTRFPHLHAVDAEADSSRSRVGSTL